MNRDLRLRPEAEDELSEAMQWYEKKADGLGAEFLLAVEECLQTITRHPLAHPGVHKTVRRALLRRFPYEILYVVRSRRIVVLAVFHAKRDPKHWIGRA